MRQHYVWLCGLLLSGAVLAAEIHDEPVVLVDDGVGAPCTPSVAGEGSTVYGGPGVNYRQKGKISQQQTLFICEKRSDWISIVYDSKNTIRPADDCQLGAYAKGAYFYTGSCNTGWIKTIPLKALSN